MLGGHRGCPCGVLENGIAAGSHAGNGSSAQERHREVGHYLVSS
jgi:hypothetical protein